MIGKLARSTSLLLGITMFAVLLLSYRTPLSLRMGSVASLPLTALAFAEGKLRVERVYSLPLVTKCDFDSGERLGVGYFMVTAPLAYIEGGSISVFSHGSDIGMGIPYELVMTERPPAVKPWIPNVRFARFYAPLWVFPLLMLSYPLGHLMLHFVRSRRRRKSGSCMNCGYDLTGNVSGVCPECGGLVRRT